MTKKFKRKKAKSKKSISKSKTKTKKSKTIQEELQKVARPIIRPMFAIPRKAGKMRLF